MLSRKLERERLTEDGTHGTNRHFRFRVWIPHLQGHLWLPSRIYLGSEKKDI